MKIALLLLFAPITLTMAQILEDQPSSNQTTLNNVGTQTTQTQTTQTQTTQTQTTLNNVGTQTTQTQTQTQTQTTLNNVGTQTTQIQTTPNKVGTPSTQAPKNSTDEPDMKTFVLVATALGVIAGTLILTCACVKVCQKCRNRERFPSHLGLERIFQNQRGPRNHYDYNYNDRYKYNVTF